MKVIIAGSRDIDEIDPIQEAVEDCGFNITEVISGTARGVDKLGEQWAEKNNIPIKQFPAKWDKFGRSAGHKRNAEMAEYAEALIAVWDGVSKGTEGMIKQAEKKGLKVYVLDVGDHYDKEVWR